jgi:hypothetical protein
MAFVGAAGPVPGPTLRGLEGGVAAAFLVEEGRAGVGASVGVTGAVEGAGVGAVSRPPNVRFEPEGAETMAICR